MLSKKKTKLKTSIVLIVTALCIVGVSYSELIGTAFTYEGSLYDANSPAEGLFDFEFALYDDSDGGLQQGYIIDVNDLDVTVGHFMVELDFGSAAFTGETRWLEVAVRAGASSDPTEFVILSPRQKITPTPYALQTRGIFVDDTGNVGIGTGSPNEKLTVITSESTGIALYCEVTDGVSLEAAGDLTVPDYSLKPPSGSGMGGSTSTDGGAGVYGGSKGILGSGVSGEATGEKGSGVQGKATGSASSGVSGSQLGQMVQPVPPGSPPPSGVSGLSEDDDGAGVVGIVMGRRGIGIQGNSKGEEGSGVMGSHEQSGNYGILGDPNYAGYFYGDVKITGDLEVIGSYYDSSSDAGTAGQILSSTGSGTDWIDPPAGTDSDWIISGSNMYTDAGITGNVGIGTTSPSEKLEINGIVKATAFLGDGSGLTGLPTGDGYSLDAADGSPVDVVYVDNEGNVGIGTTSPVDKVDVYGHINSSETYKLDGDTVLANTGTSICVGNGAGLNSTTGLNTYVGYHAGMNHATGIRNTFVGAAAGNGSISGDNNIFIGFSSGNGNTTGHDNIFTGYQAGYNNTEGNSNIFSGWRAGYWNETGVRNIYLGVTAGLFNKTGSDNICLGLGAGTYNTGSRNVFIGHKAGFNESGSDKLYIANSDVDPPLIYGDFSTGLVGIGTKTPARSLHIKDVMRLEPRSSAPSSPSEGDIYMDGVTHKLMVFDGTVWQACW